MEILRELVIKAQKGDLDAFEEIVGRFQNMAYGYAYSFLNDFDLAKDATQEAFLEAWRKLHDLREPSAFSGWFRKIILKFCDRFVRYNYRKHLGLDEIHNLAGQIPSPGEIAEIAQIRSQVYLAVNELPRQQRTVITLFYIDDYSQNEISEFLEEPLTTVKKRLHDGRKRLKERILNMMQETLRNIALPNDFAKRLLRVPYSIQKGRKEVDYPEDLKLKITHVLGSSPTVAPGETYLVRVKYSWAGKRTLTLSLVGIGVSRCFSVKLPAGSGTFEIGAEIKEVWEKKDKILDLEICDKDRSLGCPLIIKIKS